MQSNNITLSNNFIEELNKHGKKIHFNKQDNPINYINSQSKFYIILSGKIKVFNINFETNREQTISLLTRGDMYDIVVLLDGKEHDLMTEVIEKGIAIELQLSIVKEWLKTNEAFRSYILPYISKRIRDLEELSSDLSLLTTYERLTKLILKDIDQSGNILKGLSHKEIGNLIGTVRQVVERHLKENNIVLKT